MTPKVTKTGIDGQADCDPKEGIATVTPRVAPPSGLCLCQPQLVRREKQEEKDDRGDLPRGFVFP